MDSLPGKRGNAPIVARRALIMSEGSVLICFFFFLFLLGNQIFPVPKDIGIFRWVGKINNHPHLVKMSKSSVVKNILCIAETL